MQAGKMIFQSGVDLGITEQLQVRWNGIFNINKQIDGI
jgi:hypothetical protein